jgi:TPR repeat protein
MTPQQALDILGLVGSPDLSEIDSAHRSRISEVEAGLQKAADDSSKHAWIQRKASLNDAYSILMRQTLGGTTGASNTTSTPASPPTFQAPSGLSATMMADLPGAHPYQTALGTGGNMAQIASLQPGHVLANRFEIKAQIGAGGMGAVYRAHDRNRGEDIAVKVMLPGLISSDVAKQRFLNEAKIAIKLGHQHIVNTYDVQIDGAYIFITMELLEGTNLRQLMTEKKQQHQQWEEKEVLDIIRPLCEALTYAHRFTIHRDIKPENVWINRDGSIKLMDFGIARLMTDSQMTQTSAVLGTAYYMAPEQLVGAKGVDHRADQYSVGVMVYELLTERIPTGRFKQINEIRDDISQGLSDAVDQALAGHPEDRYENMAAFAEGLQAGGKAKKKVAKKTNEPSAIAQAGQSAKENLAKAAGVGLTAIEKGSKVVEGGKKAFFRLNRKVIYALAGVVIVVAVGSIWKFIEHQKEEKFRLLREEAWSYIDGSKPTIDRTEFLRLLTSAAEAGDVSSMQMIAGNINIDPAKALEWMRKGVETGEVSMMYWLADTLINGDDKYKNIEEGLRWYQKAIDKGEEDAMVPLAAALLTTDAKYKNIEEGLRWYQKAIEKGVEGAQFALATVLLEGTGGVEKNPAKALELLKSVVEKNSSDAGHALYKLYGIYTKGEGVGKDVAEGKRWLNKIYEIKDADVIAGLSYSFLNDKDMENARKLTFKAAELGNFEKATFFVIYERSENLKNAIEICNKAVEKGESLDCLTLIGDQYLRDKHYQEAVAYYQRAADKGEIEGMAKIGVMYELGLGVRGQSKTEADHWYQKAIDKKHTQAMVEIAKALTNHDLPSKRTQESLHWLTQASDAGDDEAMEELCSRYRYGSDGFPEDRAKAMSWCKKAASLGNFGAIYTLKEWKN